MNNIEFSEQFDVMLNSYSEVFDFGTTGSSHSIQLDEYEKSVLLTQAQKEFVVDCYDDNNGKGFERNELMRRYLSALVKPVTLTNKITNMDSSKLTSKSVLFQLPSDVLVITLEYIKETSNSTNTIKVKPITQDAYFSIRNNPFRMENSTRGFRLDLEGNVVEIIPPTQVYSYSIRYVSVPTPIILENIGTLTIDGVSIKTECKLHPSTHLEVLNRAVQLALQKYSLFKKQQ